MRLPIMWGLMMNIRERIVINICDQITSIFILIWEKKVFLFQYKISFLPILWSIFGYFDTTFCYRRGRHYILLLMRDYKLFMPNTFITMLCVDNLILFLWILLERIIMRGPCHHFSQIWYWIFVEWHNSILFLFDTF